MRIAALALGFLSLFGVTFAGPLSPSTIDNTSTCALPGDEHANCSPPSSSYGEWQCPHTYNFREFDPATDSNRQPYFRFQILFKMNPALCEEEAHNHWKTVHADLTLSAKNTGVLVQRYTQFHSDSKSKKAIQALVDTGTLEFAPYDAIAEFHAKDAESVVAFMNGVFENSALLSDEYFVDKSAKLQILGGWDTLMFGSGIETSGGTDGILPGDSRFNNSDE